MKKVLWTAILIALPGLAQDIPSAAGETIDVVAVEVVLDVRDERGNVPRQLSPDAVRVTEDGVPVRVLSIERLVPHSQPANDQPATLSRSGGDTEPWHLVLYFDQTLSTPQTMQMTARGLSDRAEELTGLGVVEVVVSDGAPRRIQPPTRDPRLIREALEQVRRLPGLDRLREHRRDLVQTSRSSTSARTRAAIAEEQRLIRRVSETLSEFLGQRTSARAGAVMLISDGWDLDPLDFYSQYVDDISLDELEDDASQRVAPEASEIESWSSIVSSLNGDAINRSLMVETSVSGWTVFPLGGGVPWSSNRDASVNLYGGAPPDHTGRGSADLIAHPTDPLLALADATGGIYARHPRSLDNQLDSMRNRFILTYQSARPIDGRLRRVEIQPLHAGWKIHARRWVSDAPPETLSETRVRMFGTENPPTGELPVSAEVRIAGRNHELVTTVDLSSVLPVLAQRNITRLRLTVRATDEEGRETIVHQEIELDDPGRDGEIVHVAPLMLRSSTSSVSVVVEEYSTGAWGGATTDQIPVIVPLEELVMDTVVPKERILV